MPVETKSLAKRAIENNVDIDRLGQLGPVIGLIALYVFFTIATNNFLTYRNQTTLISQVAIIGTMAIGSTFPILAGEIDLSIAQMLEVISIVMVGLSVGTFASLPIPLAIIAGFVLAILLGGTSGYITSKFGVPSFMMTLAMLFFLDGVGLRLSGGQPISAPTDLTWLGNSILPGIPYTVVVFLLLLFIAHYILSWTRYGRYIYAVGGNDKAADLVGINVRRVRMGVLILSAIFVGFGALIGIGRVGLVGPTFANSLLLPPIAAVILGGANLFGGSGNVFGTFIGVLILGTISNGLNLMGVSPSGQLIVQGIVLVVAVIANVVRK
jgi:ribose/xylose/arabinose/galactoside ABC-type transport system permease subunit